MSAGGATPGEAAGGRHGGSPAEERVPADPRAPAPPEVDAAPVVWRVVGQGDLDAFAALSGDDNPIHVDPATAARTAFGTTVAHGMLLATLVDGARHRAGVGWPWRAAALRFPAPTPAGSRVAVRLASPGGRAASDAVHLPADARETAPSPLDAVVEVDPAADETSARQPPTEAAPGDQPTTGRGWVGCEAVVAPDASALPDGALDAVAAPRPGGARDAASKAPPTGAPPPDAAPGAPPPDTDEWHALVGCEASVTCAVDADDLAAYWRLATDDPAADPPEAALPLPLVAGTISRVLGTVLPGPGTGYLKQTLALTGAVEAPARLTARVAVTRVRPDKALVDLATTVTTVRSDGAVDIVAHGRALVTARDADLRAARQRADPPDTVTHDEAHDREPPR